MTSAFDPASHRMTPSRRFEDLRVGDVYVIPQRTVTDAHFSQFQALSLDNHPIHYDVPYCQTLGHKGPLAHGLQVLALTAAGAGLFPHEIGDALIGFVDVKAKFLKAVYPGDTLYPRLEIIALKPQRTTGVVTMRATIHNQDGALVLDGEHSYLLKLSPA